MTDEKRDHEAHSAENAIGRQSDDVKWWHGHPDRNTFWIVAGSAARDELDATAGVNVESSEPVEGERGTWRLQLSTPPRGGDE